MREFWVGVSGYEGQYEISNLRRVRSLKRQVICRNGGRRTVSPKYLFTDGDTVALGNGHGKNGTVKCVTLLMIRSFYPHLDPQEYTFKIRGPRDQATLDDIDIIHNEFTWQD